jgi:hypothetical protein
MLPPVLVEVPTGIINGLNRVFQTQYPYIAGSTQVWLNGQMKDPKFADGWVENGGVFFTMKVAPEVGDVVQVYYRPSL